jgi:maleate cis-trans isomerase
MPFTQRMDEVSLHTTRIHIKYKRKTELNKLGYITNYLSDTNFKYRSHEVDVIHHQCQDSQFRQGLL